MQTVYHAYRFDTRQPAEKEAYLALKAKLGPALFARRMKSWGGKDSYYQPAFDGKVAVLETKHLFDNQWNTSDTEGQILNRRVFDWAEDYMIHGDHAIHQGHWIEQTAEMAEIRRNTHKCGYCGWQAPAAAGNVFCPQCIDSEYLKESDLPLTRMRAIDCARHEFAPLSIAERDYLVPLYHKAQLHGVTDRGQARIAKARADIEAKCAKDLKDAKMERDGFIWFMDRGIRTDNLIFYPHTSRFCFGWRQAVDAEFRSRLLDVISEFPFPYDIKGPEKVESGN